MPVTSQASKHKGAFSHLVPMETRLAILMHRKWLAALKHKHGLSYAEVLDQLDERGRKIMLKAHQTRLILWMVDNDRMTWEQFQRVFPNVSALDSIM